MPFKFEYWLYLSTKFEFSFSAILTALEETITIIHPADGEGMNKFLQVLTGKKHLILAMILRW